MRYIGSKARVVSEIVAAVGPPSSGGVFVDAFAGTGVVGAAAAEAGWPVRANDHLRCASVLTAARLTRGWETSFSRFGDYAEALEHLNSTPSRRGFVWREYSPASRGRLSIERRYFTEANASRIDGVRRKIAEWASDGTVSEAEELVLIADLLMAANRVANIAGTYGCFLREFSPNALTTMRLLPRRFARHDVPVEVHCRDVYDVPAAPNDVVYYDPPYTKRQYAAYYHILETIAVGDSPAVEGITGLRPWRDRASLFCYKSKALGAISELVACTHAHRVLLSYSSEGHVALDALQAQLQELGAVDVHVLAEIARYRPNQAASRAKSSVQEYLITIDRSGVPLEGRDLSATADQAMAGL